MTFIYRCIDLDTLKTLENCTHHHIFEYSTWSDLTIGIVLFVIALLAIFLFMYAIVKLMEDLFAGNEIYIRKMVAADLPQPFTFLTNYLLIIIGCVIVMIVSF